MTPAAQYANGLEQRDRALKRLDAAHARLGAARLLLSAVFVGTAWASWAGHAAPSWLLLPAGMFIALVIHHGRIQRRRARTGRAVAFYRQALERLDGRPVAAADAGARFLDEHHVYGGDLDLFGAGSLYERLCMARTPMGERTLAHWLLTPAPLDTIRDRQACITELRERLELREELATQGEPARLALHVTLLEAWAVAGSPLFERWLQPVAAALCAAAAATALLWAIRGVAFPFLAVVMVEAAIDFALRNRVHATLTGVEQAHEELKLLADLLQRVQREQFLTAQLCAMQARLWAGAASASSALTQLATLVNFVEARRNPLLTPLLLPTLYVLQSALAADRWRRRYGSHIADWLAVLGETEALASIAAYAFDRPEDPYPEFVDGAPSFQATGLGHPLIDLPARVRNDVDLSGTTRLLMVSGSNMSGKSTLLRAVGMNTVLAMAGAPVCAARLRLTPLQVGASIRVNDSLAEGSSRFYAEITRLRQLFDPFALPLLFLLDELLQGTNSADRRNGAQAVLRAFMRRPAIGLVSTHDLALADDALTEAGTLKNVHFQEELRGGRLHFDFILRDGVVTTSSGIELMRAIGLDV